MTNISVNAYTDDNPEQTKRVLLNVDVPAEHFGKSAGWQTRLSAFDAVRESLALKYARPSDQVGWHLDSMRLHRG